MEMATHEKWRFQKTKVKLRNVNGNATSTKQASRHHGAKLLGLLAWWKWKPHSISSRDTVWILDNTAHYSVSGQWQAEFVVAAFDSQSGVRLSKIVADIAEKVGLADDAAEATMRKRVVPFVQLALPGRSVEILFAHRSLLSSITGDSDSVSSNVKELPHFEDGEVVESVAKVPRGAKNLLELPTFYAEPEGWAVISDIDDTIKITQTSDPIGVLRSTFVSDPEPVTGMPELYTFIQTLIGTASPYFYLSASPYNLYAFLLDFCRTYFPQGTIILRDFRWMNLSDLMLNLTLATQSLKFDQMEKIHSWFPRRRMICIGDSTQTDPEVYAEIYHKYTGWIHLILIRRVSNIAAVGIEAKNEPMRFKKAFIGVHPGHWFIFDTPEQCNAILQDMVRDA